MKNDAYTPFSAQSYPTTCRVSCDVDEEVRSRFPVMSSPAYTLEFHREAQTVSNNRPPSAILLSAVIYALAVSLCDSLPALAIAAIMPAIFLATKRFSPRNLTSINTVNAVMILTFALTWPELSGGLSMGMVVALRVNMICVAFGAMVYPLGTAGMYEALCALHVPEKLRVLVILTLRGIYILRERYEAAIISVRLRAPRLRGMMRLKVFAYMMGMILLQALSRSENMTRAVKCRRGFGGFMQSEKMRLNARDWAYVAGFAVYGVVIAVMNHALR